MAPIYRVLMLLRQFPSETVMLMAGVMQRPLWCRKEYMFFRAAWELPDGEHRFNGCAVFHGD